MVILGTASDNVYQLLAHGRWLSPGTLASSSTKTGRHDIAEILLKVALKHQQSKIISNHGNPCFAYLWFSWSVTLYIFIIDQVVVFNEVQALAKLLRYTVPNLPIVSTNWRMGPQILGDQCALYFVYSYRTFNLCLFP